MTAESDKAVGADVPPLYLTRESYCSRRCSNLTSVVTPRSRE